MSASISVSSRLGMAQAASVETVPPMKKEGRGGSTGLSTIVNLQAVGMSHWEMFDGVAQAVPERTAVAWRGRHLTYGELAQRARQVANVLDGHGLGSVTPRARLAGWELSLIHI